MVPCPVAGWSIGKNFGCAARGFRWVTSGTKCGKRGLLTSGFAARLKLSLQNEDSFSALYSHHGDADVECAGVWLHNDVGLRSSLVGLVECAVLGICG